MSFSLGRESHRRGATTKKAILPVPPAKHPRPVGRREQPSQWHASHGIDGVTKDCPSDTMVLPKLFKALKVRNLQGKDTDMVSFEVWGVLVCLYNGE